MLSAWPDFPGLLNAKILVLRSSTYGPGNHLWKNKSCALNFFLNLGRLIVIKDNKFSLPNKSKERLILVLGQD